MAACVWLAAGVLLTSTRASAQNYMISLSSEMQTASDVRLSDCDLDVRWRNSQREIGVMLGLANLDVDYIPSPWDITGLRENLEDTRTTGQFTWREGLDKQWRWNFSAGGYQGYTDYRSLWLNEYYRQMFEGVPGYVVASPAGANVSIGGSYEYLPQSGFINWSVGWQTDDVSPSYDKNFGTPLQRGLGSYETWRYGLGSEHVLNSRIRFKQDATVLVTTARDLRETYRAEMLWAFVDTWATRLTLEGSHEGDFHSGAAAVALEHDWDAKYFAGITTRAYRDNGQIIDPSLVSGQAPPIDTLQMQLTARYSGPMVTWRIAIGPYWTSYATNTTRTLRFTTLYRDRDWLSMQAACTVRF